MDGSPAQEPDDVFQLLLSKTFYAGLSSDELDLSREIKRAREAWSTARSAQLLPSFAAPGDEPPYLTRDFCREVLALRMGVPAVCLSLLAEGSTTAPSSADSPREGGLLLEEDGSAKTAEAPGGPLGEESSVERGVVSGAPSSSALIEELDGSGVFLSHDAALLDCTAFMLCRSLRIMVDARPFSIRFSRKRHPSVRPRERRIVCEDWLQALLLLLGVVPTAGGVNRSRAPATEHVAQIFSMEEQSSSIGNNAASQGSSVQRYAASPRMGTGSGRANQSCDLSRPGGVCVNFASWDHLRAVAAELLEFPALDGVDRVLRHQKTRVFVVDALLFLVENGVLAWTDLFGERVDSRDGEDADDSDPGDAYNGQHDEEEDNIRTGCTFLGRLLHEGLWRPVETLLDAAHKVHKASLIMDHGGCSDQKELECLSPPAFRFPEAPPSLRKESSTSSSVVSSSKRRGLGLWGAAMDWGSPSPRGWGEAGSQPSRSVSRGVSDGEKEEGEKEKISRLMARLKKMHELLLKKADRNGSCLMHCAIGYAHCVRGLCEYERRLNAVAHENSIMSDDGEPHLISPLGSRQLEAANTDSETPVHLVCSSGDVAMLSLMLEEAAKFFSVKTSAGGCTRETLTDHASSPIKATGNNQKPKESATTTETTGDKVQKEAKVDAVTRMRHQRLREYLRKLLNEPSNDGMTPLHIACFKLDVGIVRALVKLNDLPPAEGFDNMFSSALLHDQANRGKMEAAAQDPSSSSTKTAGSAASSASSSAARTSTSAKSATWFTSVETVADHVMDAEKIVSLNYAHRTHGCTALHYAACNVGTRCEVIVRILLEAEADPRVRTARGETALALATTRAHNRGVVQTLVEFGAEEDDFSQDDELRGAEDLAEEELNAGGGARSEERGRLANEEQAWWAAPEHQARPGADGIWMSGQGGAVLGSSTAEQRRHAAPSTGAWMRLQAEREWDTDFLQPSET
ncbi:unnamed protein product [Amoebophrya sp. A25]|nr:unnamed protein product [Amoebophrya sp. A25]|eukprot:GSA25T00012049001.1